MEQGPGFWSTVQKQSSSELRFPYDPNLTSICNYWKHLDLTLWSFVGKVLSLLFRLQSLVSLRVRHDWATSLSLFAFMHWRRKWQPTPVFLPGESQGQRSLVGCVYGVPQSRTWLKWLSSRLVITFLPRSKCLLISRLQSPSAMILEPKKIKSVTVSIVFPSICHEVVGPMLWSSFCECWVLSQLFSLSSFRPCNTLILISKPELESLLENSPNPPGFGHRLWDAWVCCVPMFLEK